jgi:hypothetical protein
LKLIKLTQEQMLKKTATLKFVYDLPTSKEHLVKTIESFKNAEEALIGLQRIRDVHNPALLKKTANEPEKEAEQRMDFDKFVLSLLLVYLDMSESEWSGRESKEENEKFESIKLHLKELTALSGSDKASMGSSAILDFVKEQMTGIVSLLTSRDSDQRMP